MKSIELLRAALLPATNTSVLFALLTFWALLCLVAMAGMLGVWLAIVIVPALFRYLTNLVETIGSGRLPRPPGSEFFRWVGELWSLFPAVIVIAVALGSYSLALAAGTGPMIAFIAIMGCLYPAMLGVLAITHSPLQSCSPIALSNLVRRLGFSYLIAPAYLALMVYVSTLAQALPLVAELFVELFLVFSLHSVLGSVMAPRDVFSDVYIPDPLQLGEDKTAAEITQTRKEVLTHAYAFISRGNREGGFEHIMEWIAKDPEVPAAWAWYFEQMLSWQNKEPALHFARRYIHDMLQHGERIPALKVILRCRMFDETFRPLPDDLPAAIAAAENSGNFELAAVLQR